MITFKYNTIAADDRTEIAVEAVSNAETIGAVVAAFKEFLHHVGYHADNIAAVTYDDSVERQELPEELELFPEDPS